MGKPVEEKKVLGKTYTGNKKLFKEVFDNDANIVFREFAARHSGIKICAVFNNSLSDKNIINNNVINPILNYRHDRDKSTKPLEFLSEEVIDAADITRSNDIDSLVGYVLMGDTVLLVENAPEAIVVNSKKWAIRQISEPRAENVVRGPRESFTESILVNVSQLRRKIKDANLKFEFREIGKKTKTSICICYMEDIVNKKLLVELDKRLENINIDVILESGYITEFISDSPLSPFATIGDTERPDKVAGNLLEGRIALMVDGTPFVLTMPFLFAEYFQSSEDYSNHYIFGSLNRLLRLFSFFITTSLPPIYVALATYHQEMIPTPLILSISASREGLPFPTIVEAIIMLGAFEILREAGVRLPSAIGQTISFVGAVILGEAAITARIVSAPIVIVIAITGISGFLIPKMLGALNVVRIIFILSAAFLGLYGYIFAAMALFIHLMSIRSFGYPYTLNIGSLKGQDLKDTAVRAPWWLMNKRPRLLGVINPVRHRSLRKRIKK